MSCKLGYPEKPCPYEHKGRVTRDSCGPCKEYEPPRHILKWCMLWDRDKVLCMKPKTACEKCHEKAPERGPGRPAGEAKLDLSMPEDRRKYEEEYRKKAADKIAEKRERFFEKHPHYMREYMKQYRARQKEKGEGSDESGSGKV